MLDAVPSRETEEEAPVDVVVLSSTQNMLVESDGPAGSDWVCVKVSVAVDKEGSTVLPSPVVEIRTWPLELVI